jgi:hypothetical protein
VSPPSQSGCFAVESEGDEVLNNSYLPGQSLQRWISSESFSDDEIDGRTKELAERQLETSLERLQTDHIDLVQLMHTLNGRYGLALQDNAVSHRFHTKYADFSFDQFGQYHLAETPKMGVHYIQRHLRRIEVKAVICGNLQHIRTSPL